MMKRSCSDVCCCRNLVCGITFLVIGITFVIVGGVVAAVGFGTWPKDTSDIKNLSMRVCGLILAGTGILPIVLGIMSLVFYCGHRSGKYPIRKKGFDNNELAVISRDRPGPNEYPYPSKGGPLIYKPGPDADDSLAKGSDFSKNDSFSAPLNQSQRSFNNGGVDSPPIYSDIGELKGTKTRTMTTTTTTRVYKTTFDDATASGSSGVPSYSDNPDESEPKKTKHPKKHNLEEAQEMLSGSSEVPSFNDGEVGFEQKSKRPKKHKKKTTRTERSVQEEIEDEPLTVSVNVKYQQQDGSDSSNTVAHKTRAKPHRSTTSEGEDELPVYGKVDKRRDNRV